MRLIGLTYLKPQRRNITMGSYAENEQDAREYAELQRQFAEEKLEEQRERVAKEKPVVTMDEIIQHRFQQRNLENAERHTNICNVRQILKFNLTERILNVAQISIFSNPESCPDQNAHLSTNTRYTTLPIESGRIQLDCPSEEAALVAHQRTYGCAEVMRGFYLVLLGRILQL